MSHWRVCYFLCFSILSIDLISAYKILMLCPSPIKSHHNLCKGITNTLASRGHELTFISAFPSNNPTYREIGINMGNISKTFPMGFDRANMSFSKSMDLLKNWGPAMMSSIFLNEEVQILFNNRSEVFDLFILEYYISEILLGFSVRFDCPAIILSSVPLMTWLSTLTGNPLSVATIPHISTPYTQNMNMQQRLVNLIQHVVQHLVGVFVIDKPYGELYKKYFVEESKIVPYDQINTLISSVLVNSHPSYGLARPMLPNTVEIGGYHIDDPEPLPEDLEIIMNNSKHGVILFSLGSNAQSKSIDPHIINIILNTFSSMKETILWKFEENLPEKSENVIIKTWMPQTSILAHPNTKLFISHGGLLSCAEAAHFGIPMLIIPIFGDQPQNAMIVNEKGFGLHLGYTNISDATLKWTLDEMLNNPKYADNAKMISKLYHDRPMKPRDLLTYHVEHVIRTRGAAHLSSPKLSVTSIFILDIMAILLISTQTIIVILILLCLKLCCGGRAKNSGEKIKKS